ncbi:SpoIIE family protein phosphatase [bacterium SCSIO 12741]|nr:SpoIIE family protein phosphatase [bacterium SCSIO 12741]
MLKRLYRTLEESLGESGQLRDGFDISLIAIPEGYNSLYYSGMNSNAYLYPKSGSPIYLTGDRSLQTERLGAHTFRCQEISLESEAELFLFSDGIKDQFGGSKNKKFTAKRLKQLTLEISQMPIQEQQAQVEKQLWNWKGDNEQTDDIILAGIRITADGKAISKTLPVEKSTISIQEPKARLTVSSSQEDWNGEHLTHLLQKLKASPAKSLIIDLSAINSLDEQGATILLENLNDRLQNHSMEQITIIAPSNLFDRCAFFHSLNEVNPQALAQSEILLKD